MLNLIVVGTLTVLSGAPQVQVSSGGASRLVANQGQIFQGDQVHTGRDQSAVLALSDLSEVTISPETELTVERFVNTPTDHAAELSIGHDHAQEMAYFVVSKNTYTEKKPFTIRTASAAMGVRGTEFVVENSQKDEVTLHTLEGAVAIGRTPEDLVRPGQAQLVSAGNMSSANRTTIRPSAPQHFDQKVFMAAVARRSPHVARQIEKPRAAQRAPQVPTPAQRTKQLQPQSSKNSSQPAKQKLPLKKVIRKNEKRIEKKKVVKKKKE